MKCPIHLSPVFSLVLVLLFAAACGGSNPGPALPPAAPTPGLPPSASPSLQPPPVPPSLQPPAPLPELVNDFTPCTGAPSGQATTPGAGRALLAYSPNGFDFHRPADPLDGLLVDRAGVTDGVVLPNGRILIYFVDGCRPYDGTQPGRSAVSVAVSDGHGVPGSWIFKNVQFIGVPPEERFGYSIVDPNVVLLPDGSLRIFATMFRPGENGTALNGAYSFHSGDGGFTYSFEGLRYDDILDPENYRFTDTNWQIFTGGPKGLAMSTDGGNTFLTLGAFPLSKGAVHEIAVTDKPGEYRAYLTGPEGIQSFLSTSAPWTTWTEEPGFRLQVDSSTGLESCELAFPTVLRLGPSNYLMVYLASIPGCACGEDPICQ